MDPKRAHAIGQLLGMAKSAGSGAFTAPTHWTGAGQAPLRPGEWQDYSAELDPTGYGKTPMLARSETGVRRKASLPSYMNAPDELQGMYRFRGWSDGEPWIQPVTQAQWQSKGGDPSQGYFTAYRPAQEFKRALPKSVWGQGAATTAATQAAGKPAAQPAVTAPSGMGSGGDTADAPAITPKTETPSAADSAVQPPPDTAVQPPPDTAVQPPPDTAVQPPPETPAKAAPQAAAGQITAEQHKQLVAAGFTPPAQQPQVSDELRQLALRSGWGAPAAAGGQSSADLTGYYQMSPQQQAEYMRQHSLKFTGKTMPQYDAAQQAMLAGLGRAYQARQTNRWLQALFGG